MAHTLSNKAPVKVEVEAFHSLSASDLQQGKAVGLPSGETIARHIGAAPLTREQTGLGSMGWDGEFTMADLLGFVDS